MVQISQFNCSSISIENSKIEQIILKDRKSFLKLLSLFVDTTVTKLKTIPLEYDSNGLKSGYLVGSGYSFISTGQEVLNLEENLIRKQAAKYLKNTKGQITQFGKIEGKELVYISIESSEKLKEKLFPKGEKESDKLVFEYIKNNLSWKDISQLLQASGSPFKYKGPTSKKTITLKRLQTAGQLILAEDDNYYVREYPSNYSTLFFHELGMDTPRKFELDSNNMPIEGCYIKGTMPGKNSSNIKHLIEAELKRNPPRIFAFGMLERSLTYLSSEDNSEESIVMQICSKFDNKQPSKEFISLLKDLQWTKIVFLLRNLDEEITVGILRNNLTAKEISFLIGKGLLKPKRTSSDKEKLKLVPHIVLEKSTNSTPQVRIYSFIVQSTLDSNS